MRIFVSGFYFGSGIDQDPLKQKVSGPTGSGSTQPCPTPPKKSSSLQWDITTSPWPPAQKKGARYADLEGENQLEVEGWIAGGRVNGAEAEVLAGVLGGRLAQDPACNI